MQTSGVHLHPLALASLLAAVLTAASACVPDRIDVGDRGPFAPGVDPRGETVSGVEVGNRLMQAGEYDLAMDAFTRAALKEGMTPEILSGMGTANLGLGRLGQAEKLLRRAVEDAPDWPAPLNNLGVVLMEQGKVLEARQLFHKAYALDNGQSDSIRDNLRLALAKSENSVTIPDQEDSYKLVRRGSGDYLVRPAS